MYLVFVTAGLIAAPRRTSWLAMLVAMIVTGVYVSRDIEARPPIQTAGASDPGMPDLKQADRVAPLSLERRG
jgi:hypothetical protein